MGMLLSSLELVDFRNYETYALSDIGGLTVLIGVNGVGKTNILEATHLITSANSFRHSQINQIIRQGCNSARVRANLADGNRDLAFELYLEPGKKRFTINGKAKASTEIRGILPAVSFVPDDLEIAKKSSGVKRDTLDDLGSQLAKNYHVVRRDYEKVLRYKNRLLKDEAPQSLIDAMNDTFVECAAQLHCYRRALHNKIVPLVEARYYEIALSQDGFSSSYIASWDYLQQGDKTVSPGGSPHSVIERDYAKECLWKAIESYAAEERARKRCVVGPHNDKIAFFLADRDASQFASQGQQRSIVLAWKLAEVEVIRQTLGTNPILLLDDVMSELDSHRRDMLVNCVGNDIQTFITATDLSPFNDQLLSRARVVELSEACR